MNYDSITDKPFIQIKAGATIHICVSCVERKYTSAPEATSRGVWCACESCSKIAECQEIVKARLIAKPSKKRVKKVSAMDQFGIVKRTGGK